MNKTLGFVAAVLVLAATGCSAQTPEQQALDLCVKSASAQLDGASLNRDGLEVTNMGDALFDAGITETKSSDTSNALFTVAGKITWTEGSTTKRKSMVCTVKYEDGKPSVNASLS